MISYLNDDLFSLFRNTLTECNSVINDRLIQNTELSKNDISVYASCIQYELSAFLYFVSSCTLQGIPHDNSFDVLGIEITDYLFDRSNSITENLKKYNYDTVDYSLFLSSRFSDYEHIFLGDLPVLPIGSKRTFDDKKKDLLYRCSQVMGHFSLHYINEKYCCSLESTYGMKRYMIFINMDFYSCLFSDLFDIVYNYYINAVYMIKNGNSNQSDPSDSSPFSAIFPIASFIIVIIGVVIFFLK